MIDGLPTFDKRIHQWVAQRMVSRLQQTVAWMLAEQAMHCSAEAIDFLNKTQSSCLCLTYVLLHQCADKFTQMVKACGQHDSASKQVCTLLTSSAYSRSSTVFWRTDRGSLKYTGRQMRLRSLPMHSLRIDHKLTLLSCCLGGGRTSLLWGGACISL